MRTVRQQSVTWIVALLLSGLFAASTGAIELREFESADDRARFKTLLHELRCLVCQNQSLADSDAELAQDLRQQVHEMVESGQTNDDIVDFMVQRYGNFVRYRPPFTAKTAALWIGPFALVLIGLWTLFSQLKKHRARKDLGADKLSADEQARLDALLNRAEDK